MTPTYATRSGDFLESSMIFNGVGLHEACGCAFILISKLLADYKVWKTPIFYMSLISLIVNTIDAPPETLDSPHWQSYYTALKLYTCIVNLPQVFTHCVILLRLRGFTDTRSKSFVSIGILVGLHALVYAANVYLGITVTQTQIFYQAPLYPIWIMSNGLCVVLDAIINIVASILFVLQIANALNIPQNQIFSIMMLRHDGLRWLTIIGMNCYFVTSVLYAVLINSTAKLVSVSYHAAPFGMYVVLYTFLECSYVAARTIIEEHSLAKKDLHLETKGKTHFTTSGPI
ncbi:hypothetical protein EDD86DRAFT_262454 [Gorgonomyces haynaldii]|nr:hypothetical protein EDD86DRAFT_262454 [Gorgonomyces haynaldii]